MFPALTPWSASRPALTPHGLPLGAWLTCLGLSLVAVGCRADDPKVDPFDYVHPLGEDDTICGRADFDAMFPYSLRSEKHPVLVHYYKEVEQETARQVLEYVDKGWDFHVNQLGMRPALPDQGACGPDEAFDVFVWKGHRSSLVDALSTNDATEWDDRSSYMVVDPWGPYGGPELEETVVHEMAHASQAADDWYESPITFEMSAVFTDQVYADRYIKTYFDDFQAHPDWALDRDDKYETWYMYGASMYLLYLKDRFFGGDPRFLSSLWLASRSPPGAEDDQTLNEPDFADALDAMLRDKGSSYLQTVPEFARWRWYTGDHVDEHHFHHFKNGLENLQAAKLALAAQQEATPGALRITENAPMMLGTSYLELSSGAATPRKVYVSLEAPIDLKVRFVLQAVPGLTPNSDGEILDLSSGPKELKFAADQKRTLIVTAMPTGAYDPDLRDETRHPFSIVLSDHP